MWTKIGTFLLDYILKRAWSWFLLNQKTKKQDQEAEKAAEEFKKVVDDKTKTREERRDAEDKFLNS